MKDGGTKTPKHLAHVEWIDQGWLPIAIGFVPSEAAWNAMAKRYRVDAKWPDGPPKSGHTQVFKNETTGEAFIAVVVFPAGESDAAEVITTLVHEAVHVWQFICEQIGETSPGIEMEAYAIEAITAGLVEAYVKTCGKGRKWEIN